MSKDVTSNVAGLPIPLPVPKNEIKDLTTRENHNPDSNDVKLNEKNLMISNIQVTKQNKRKNINPKKKKLKELLFSLPKAHEVLSSIS